MSNRQTRREQSRQSRPARQNRPSRPAPRGPQGRRPVASGGGPSWLTRPFLLAVGAVIIALAVILGIVVAMQGDGGGGLSPKLTEARANLPLDMANGTKIGKDDAPLKLVAYEDFQCPFCLKYTANEEPSIIKEYVAAGKLQYQFKQLPLLGSESVRAATASYCAADQGKFWEYHHRLYLVQADAGQDTSEKTQAGRFSDDNLKKYAADLGLDAGKFESCLNSSEALAKVQDDKREASNFGFQGTPAFTLNGKPSGQGSLDISDWRKLLDDAYNAVTASPTATASASASGTASASAAATTPSPASSPTAAASPTATATR